MKKYHIIFKLKAEDFQSTGENFEAFRIGRALTDFDNKYPGAVFIACYDLDALSALNISGKQFESLVEKDDLRVPIPE